jgi:hypothetical protein
MNGMLLYVMSNLKRLYPKSLYVSNIMSTAPIYPAFNSLASDMPEYVNITFLNTKWADMRTALVVV